MKSMWDQLLWAMVLVRLGQELGSDSRLAKAVFLAVEWLGIAAKIFGVDRF